MPLPWPSSYSSSGCHRSPGWQQWARRTPGGLRGQTQHTVKGGGSLEGRCDGTDVEDQRRENDAPRGKMSVLLPCVTTQPGDPPGHQAVITG